MGKRKKISFKEILKKHKSQEKKKKDKKETGSKKKRDKKGKETKKVKQKSKEMPREKVKSGKTTVAAKEAEMSPKREEIMIARVKNEFYGIPLSCVEEIERDIKLTNPPQLSEVLSGIAEIRDLFIPVVNLGKLLGIEEVQKGETDLPVIIVKFSDQLVGFQISEIVEIVEISRARLLQLPDIFPAKLFSGGYDYKSIVVGILNLESLLKGKQIQSFKEKIDETIK